MNKEKTSLELWKKLDELYLVKSVFGIISLKVLKFKIYLSKSFERNLDELKIMVIQYADFGEELSEENDTIIFLNFVSEVFKDFKNA